MTGDTLTGNNRKSTLASHNSWSFLGTDKWYLRPFAFMGKCQRCDIRTQYERHGVRCFDLRLRQHDKTVHDRTVIAHGLAEYKYTMDQLAQDLLYLNEKRDCMVRVLHETRTTAQHTAERVEHFRRVCSYLEDTFSDIRFFCGRNLADWTFDYTFKECEPTCTEDYSSVSKYKYLIGWWPWLYAKLNNRRIREGKHETELLMIDYIDIE